MERQTLRVFVSGVVALMLMGLVIAPTRAFAQGSVTATLSGTVFDSSEAVVPGAIITAKNMGTSALATAVSGSDGLFAIPMLPAGDYTVTVTKQGFKTVTLQDVRLNAGVPATIKPILTPGGFTEVVEVQGAGEVLKTTQTTVATTITQQQITNLPLPGRGAFDMVMFMPGISTTDGSSRGAMINGLPTATVNITLDGMNIQDNYAKTWDGMFTRVSPRLDAVEEVTISTAGLTADMAGQGGAQVKFVTKSGTNTYHGSAYYYLRRDWMNSNTWYNLHSAVSKTDGAPSLVPTQKQYQPGGSIGGPVRIPKLFNGRDKLFFFVNYEWVSSPGNSNQTKTIMSPLSEQGIFQYAGGPNVDLMALAAKNGQIAKIDPTVARLLGDVRKSTSGGVVNNTTDPLTQQLVWQQPTKSKTTYPTVKIDYNLNSKHSISGSYTRNKLLSDPDTTNSMQANFPGFPIHGLQDSLRYSGQGTWRWTVTNHIVNEFRYGKTGGATLFYPDLTADMFSGTGFGGMNGYAIDWRAFKSLSNAYYNSANSSREGKTTVFEDTINWMKGAHMLTMGVSYTKAQVWLYNQTKVPVVTLGMTTSGDPADNGLIFSTKNFPGASSTDLTNAKNLYAVLTGRVNAITRNARIQSDGSTYKILGSSNQYGTLPQWGSFISDSWHWKPNVTINAGLRYDVQRPFYADNNSYSMATLGDLFGVTGMGSDFQPGSVVNHLGNLFKPGTLEGTATTFKTLKQGTNAYNVDWGNFAPSLGAAWNVGAKSGILHMLLGDTGSSVLRGGANYAFQRGGMSDFTGPFGANPGISIDTSRNLANNNLGTLPVLLSSSDLGPPSANLTRTDPMAVPNVSSSVYAFDPNIKTPSIFSYSFSWQRQLSKDMSLEARYIHTNSFNQWTGGQQLNYMDLNELNISENGFMNEFKKAMSNLQANIAAGKGNTFAYTGAPGTSPLPIFLAYLNGSTAANTAASYTGSGWTSSTMVQAMYPLNPTPQTAASSIRLSSTYLNNGKNAGYPTNFWVANPDVNHAYLITNAPQTSYNGVQISLNRRFTHGLLFQANYTYGKAWMDQFYSLHKPFRTTEMNYTNIYTNEGGNATGNVRHVLVGNWMYELPFGRGKRFGSGANGFWNRVIGGWGFQGVARLQSGRMLDFGNVNLVGMTADELRSAYKLRKATDPQNQFRTLVYMLPQDIIDNSIKAFSVNATGYSAGAPTGRYMAPANSANCMEAAIVPGGTATAPTYSGRDGFGDCGGRSLVVAGPMVMRSDFNFIKRIQVKERIWLEGQAQIFNVFNNVNFNPNNYVGSVSDSYQVCSTSSACAVDQSRTMQLALRITF
jgi:hypothetical protein